MMRNPMLDALTNRNSMKPMLDMVRKSTNPQAMLNEIAKTNPNMKQALEYARLAGDPKTAFYKLAEAKGVDPESILSQLRE